MHRDGSYRWFYARGKVIQLDDQGRPLLVAGIVFDISEKKAEEEERRKQALALAKRVQEMHLLIRASNLAHKWPLPIPEMLPRMVDFIPEAWQCAETHCCPYPLQGCGVRDRRFQDFSSDARRGH
jgi:PAS domain-containing protein